MFDDISVGITFVMKNYEELQGKISNIQKSMDDISEKKIDKPVKEASKHAVTFGKGMKNAFKNAKNLFYALLTVRGVWFAIRKAMTTYLSENEELQNKLDAAFYAVGSMFAPALEYILNIFIKLVAYVDVFVKALGFAGMNMANFNKSAKEAKKNLAGFDEINNLNKNDSSSITTNPFENVVLDQSVVSVIKKIGGFLKPIVDYIKEMDLTGVLTTIGLIVGAYNMWKVATNLLSGAFGEKNEVLDTQSTLENVAAYVLVPALIAAYGLLKDGVNDLDGAMSNLNENKGWATVGALATAFDLAVQGVQKALKTLKEDLDDKKEKVSTWVNDVSASFNTWKQTTATTVTTWVNDTKDKVKGWYNNTKSNISSWVTMTAGNFSNWKNTVNYNISSWAGAFYSYVSSALSSTGSSANNWMSTTSNNFSSWIRTTSSNIGSWATSISETVAEAFSSAWESFKSFMTSTGEKISGWFSRGKRVATFGVALTGLSLTSLHLIGSSLLKRNLPSYDIGTNYVPNDMVAQIHQGEAIIPKKFNSNEYFNNEETNSLLRQLIDVVDTKEFKTYISQREVGKAAVNYINYQSRVMGGALV